MSKVKDVFIENLVKELNSINEDRVYHDKYPLDVCYMVSAIDQHIEECKEFIDDISNNTYCINGYDEDNSDGYTDGKIRILIEKPEEQKESERMMDAFYNYSYYIEFLHDDRYWGYCQCDSDDVNYNENHKCCGMGCDWTAPRFNLTKEIDMGCNSWTGQEKDYWEYEDNFNNNDKNKKEEVEKFIKEQRIKRIKVEIENLQKELKNI